MDKLQQEIFRRKSLLFRANHRGMKEMDYILGKYAQHKIAALHPEQLDELEYIMSFEDRDLLSWFFGEVKLPQELDKKIFWDIVKFHNIDSVI